MASSMLVPTSTPLPSIEPIQLITLEIAREALADAGYAARPFPRGRTAVIFGAPIPEGLALLNQNLGAAQNLQYIKEMVPTARVVTQPQEDNRNYRVRFDKIHNVLNFQPRYTVRDGIQEIMDAFATGQITDYRDPRYNNFSFLKLNGKLRPISVEDVGGWDWVKLSATDAMLLAEVVMAVVESQSQELMSRLRESLVQAVLGDVDGFLNILTGMQPTPPVWAQAAPAPDRQPVFVEPRLEGRPSAVTVTAG